MSSGSMNHTNVFSNDGSFLKRFQNSGNKMGGFGSGANTKTGASVGGNVSKSGGADKAASLLAQKRYEIDELMRTRGRSSHIARNKAVLGLGVSGYRDGHGYANRSGNGYEMDQGSDRDKQQQRNSYAKALAEYKDQLLTDDSDINRPLVK